MSITASLEQLAPSFTGELLQPSDAGYDAARRVRPLRGTEETRDGVL